MPRASTSRSSRCAWPNNSGLVHRRERLQRCAAVRLGDRDADERIRIGFAVVQLPFHHPVRLAVQLALLDNLSKGRIDVGVGKGTIYNEYEFVGHGLRSDDSRERMEEAIEILERLWRGESQLRNQVV